jgi:hypothetical protein
VGADEGIHKYALGKKKNKNGNKIQDQRNDWERKETKLEKEGSLIENQGCRSSSLNS